MFSFSTAPLNSFTSSAIFNQITSLTFSKKPFVYQVKKY
jgi:hypothetical protein